MMKFKNIIFSISLVLANSSSVLADYLAIIDVESYQAADESTQQVYVVGWLEGITIGSQFWTSAIAQAAKVDDGTNVLNDCLGTLSPSDFRAIVNAALVLGKPPKESTMNEIMLNTLSNFCGE